MKKYFTTAECVRKTGVSPEKIRTLCKTKEVKHKKTKTGSYLINIDSLRLWQENHLNYKQKPQWLGNPSLVFGNLELNFDTLFKPVLSTNNADEIFDPQRNEFHLQYWISNTGKVFDSDTGVYLNPDIKNGYYYVNLQRKKNESEHVYIHFLVAYYFCKGWLVKREIHHIDKNPLNNHYANLIWVTHAEHMELHRLFDNDKETYNKRIQEIQAENNKW